MKLTLISSILLFCLGLNGYGQKIQYSKGTLQVSDPNETQLVSNINGYHHVLTFSYNRKPSITIFSPQLQLLEKKHLEYTIKKDCDVRIVQFPDYYFVYLRFFKPSQFELWKIDKQGNSERLSDKLRKVIDSSFKNRSANLQLLNVDGKLYALAQTYYDTLKSINGTIVDLDENLIAGNEVDLLYPFDRATDFLQQTMLTKDALFVLKTTRDYQAGNSIDIIKIDLATGELLATTFSTGFQFHQNPGFAISAKDSSILVYSMLGQIDANRSMERSVMISRLNRELKEQSPLTLLKSQFKQNTVTNFLLVDGEPSLWLSMNSARRIQRTAYSGPVMNEPVGSINMPRIVYGSTDNSYYRQPMGVRFTVLNEQLKTKADSVAANDKKVVEIQSYPFGQFELNDKSCLVLVQNFTVKRKGLLMMSSNENNNLVATALPVFDKYDYLLSQLQFWDNYFIVPYSFKNEMGLMKVTIRPNQF